MNKEIVRYKACLVAQGFSQSPGIDYEETYSPRNEHYNVPLPNPFGSFQKTEYAAYGHGNRVSLWGSRYGNIHESSRRTSIDWFK